MKFKTIFSPIRPLLSVKIILKERFQRIEISKKIDSYFLRGFYQIVNFFSFK